MTQQEVKNEIINCLILYQPDIKKQLETLKATKEALLLTESPAYRQDLNDQYEYRIKQSIAFYVANVLRWIPIEFIFIELEKIELEDYLDV